MIGIFSITYIFSFILNSLIYKKKLNIVNIIITPWYICSIISMYGFYNTYIPTKITYKYILTFLIVFQFFSAIFYKFKYKLHVDKSEDKNIEWLKLRYVLIFCMIILGIYTIKGMKVFLSTGSFDAVRNGYLQYEFISNQMQMLISILITPLGYAIGIYSIIDYIENKKIRTTMILYIFFLLEIIFTTGGRDKIVDLLVIIIIALLDKYKNNIILIIKKNKKITMILLMGIILVLVITSQRNLSGGGLLYNIYAYFVGSIHLIGVYLKTPERYLLTSENYLYGQILISGFAYPFTFILKKIGINCTAGIYIINEVTQKFVAISERTRISNNVTCLYAAIRDFGNFGVLIYPMILSLFLINFYKKKEKYENIYNKALYYNYVSNALFLLFSFNFANPTVIFSFIYLYLINKLYNKKKKI